MFGTLRYITGCLGIVKGWAGIKIDDRRRDLFTSNNQISDYVSTSNVLMESLKIICTLPIDNKLYMTISPEFSSHRCQI